MLELTVLSENTVYKKKLKAEHGWSLLIEKDRETILFDTGATNNFLNNAEIIGKDIKKITYLILSHGHYDHTGGLLSFCELNKDADIIIHPDILNEKYSFKNNELSYIGIPEIPYEIKNRFIFCENSYRLFEDCFTTGYIETNNKLDSNDHFYLDNNMKEQDLFSDEQCLIINSIFGYILILGCCHKGLTSTLKHIKNKFGISEFYMILGGLHINNVNDKIIMDTVRSILEFKIEKIGISHCTGINGYFYLKKLFPDKVFPFNTGDSIKFD